MWLLVEWLLVQSCFGDRIAGKGGGALNAVKIQEAKILSHIELMDLLKSDWYL